MLFVILTILHACSRTIHACSRTIHVCSRTIHACCRTIHVCSKTIHACCRNFTLVEELDGYSLIEAHVLCLYFRITVEYFTVTIIYPVVPNIFNFGPNYHCAQLFEEIWLLLEDLGQYLAELLCSTDIDLCSGSPVQYRTV